MVLKATKKVVKRKEKSGKKSNQTRQYCVIDRNESVKTKFLSLNNKKLRTIDEKIKINSTRKLLIMM